MAKQITPENCGGPYKALPVPVPPEELFERAIGYEGDADLLMLFWTPEGDEVMYDDGRAGGTGNWEPYLAFVRHPKVAPFLLGANLGSSDRYAEDVLLLRRRDRQLLVMPMPVAQAIIRDWWQEGAVTEPGEPMEVTPEALAQLAEALREHMASITHDEIAYHLRKRLETTRALQEWLNNA